METKTLTSTIALIFLITGSSAIAMDKDSEQNVSSPVAKPSSDLLKETDSINPPLLTSTSTPSDKEEGQTPPLPSSKRWTLTQWLTLGWYGGSPSPSVILSKEEKKEEVKIDPILPIARTPVAQLDIDESTGLSNGWQLVSRDISKSVTLQKSVEGIEILGENYTIYTDIPDLKDLDQTTFLFNVELRGTKPGTYIQYWDGVKSVNSTPYNGNGEWETLSVEFKVDAQQARFHRLYAAILGVTKGSDIPSVTVRNVKFEQKQL